MISPYERPGAVDPAGPRPHPKCWVSLTSGQVRAALASVSIDTEGKG